MNAAAAPAPVRPPGTTATVALLACAAFFSGAAIRVCDALLPRLALDFEVTPGTAGRVIISFTVAYGLMQLVFGPLGDRYGKLRVIAAAISACAGGAMVCALAPGFDALVAMRVLWGMAAAGVIPLAMAWIGDTVPYEHRQATLARLLMGTLGGMTAGQLAGGLFADSAWGWRGAFLMLAVGYALVAGPLWLRQRHAARPALAGDGRRPSFVAQLRLVLSVRWARVVLLAVMAEGAFLLGPLAFLPAWLHRQFGLSLSAASALIALYAVGGLAYALIARRIVARLGERRMALVGGVVMGLGHLAWWLAPAAWIAGPVAFVVGFGTYLYHNTLQTHATQMAPAARGTSTALFSFCLFFGQAIGVTLAGLAFDHVGAVLLLLVPAAVLPVVGWAFARALQARDA